MALHGHATIELTDVETGEVTKIEEDNLVTNGLAKVLQYVPTETYPPITKVLAPRTDSVDGSSGLVRSARMMTGGILLFDSKLDEDVDNIIPPAGVRTVGCAASVAYTGDNTMAGSYNEAESGEVENGYKHVWDFATSQANGQIASVCLTTREGGFAGAGTYPYDKAYSFSQNSLGSSAPNYLDDLSQRTDSCFGLPKEYDSGKTVAEQILYADYNDGVMYCFADVQEWYYSFYDFYNPLSDDNKESFIYKKTLTLSKRRLMLKDISILDTNAKNNIYSSGLVFSAADGYSTKVLEEITIEMPDSLQEVMDTYLSTSGRCKVEHSCDEGFLYILIYRKTNSTSAAFDIAADDTFHVWKINMSDYTSEHIAMQNKTGTQLMAGTNEGAETRMKNKNFYITNSHVLAMTRDDKSFYLINLKNSNDIVRVIYPNGKIPVWGAQFFSNSFCINGKIYINTRVIDTVTGEMRIRNLLSGSYGFSNTTESIYVQGSDNMILGRYYYYGSSSSSYVYANLACLPETLLTINNLATPVTKTSAQSMKITYTLTELTD